MRQLTRRDFIRTSLAGAGLLATTPTLLRGADSGTKASFKGSDIVTLGKTGIKCSRLAQGTGQRGGIVE